MQGIFQRNYHFLCYLFLATQEYLHHRENKFPPSLVDYILIRWKEFIFLCESKQIRWDNFLMNSVQVVSTFQLIFWSPPFMCSLTKLVHRQINALSIFWRIIVFPALLHHLSIIHVRWHLERLNIFPLTGQ